MKSFNKSGKISKSLVVWIILTAALVIYLALAVILPRDIEIRYFSKEECPDGLRLVLTTTSEIYLETDEDLVAIYGRSRLKDPVTMRVRFKGFRSYTKDLLGNDFTYPIPVFEIIE